MFNPQDVARMLATHNVQDKTDRAPTSFHLSVAVVERFKKVAGKKNARILEDMMEQFCAIAEQLEASKAAAEKPITENTVSAEED